MNGRKVPEVGGEEFTLYKHIPKSPIICKDCKRKMSSIRSTMEVEIESDKEVSISFAFFL